MSKKQISIMFTDTSVRDYIVTADSIEECEKIFDMIWLHKEQSIYDLCFQYNVNAKTKMWVHYEMNDKKIASYDDEPMRLDTKEDE